MNNGIRIRNIEPQEITIEGATTVAGITNVYVNGVDVTVGTKAYVIVPTKTSELTNDSGFITSYTETDPTVPAYVKAISLADINAWNDKQNELVSGVNIKTINNNSLLGSGDIQITATEYQAGTGIDITGDTISNTITSYQDLTDLPTIPTTTGELINTSGFINNTVNDLTNYIRADLLEDILPSVSDSGTELYLQDTAPYTLHLELNPSEIGQFTTTGKNLFDNIISDTTFLQRCTITMEDGEMVMSATGSDCYFGNITSTGSPWDNTKGQLISVESSTQYTFSSTNSAINKSFITFYDENKLSIQVIFDVPYQSTFTTPAAAKYLSMRVVKNDSVNGESYKFNIQVEKSGTVTSYEPYTGGIPSPNPDYPQDIHVISDENSVTISSNNLTNIENSNIHLITNYDGTTTENPYINSMIINTENHNNIYVSGDFTMLSNGLVKYGIYDEYPNISTTGTRANLGSNGSISTTGNYILLSFLPDGAYTYEDIQNSFMINYGSTAAPHVPHEERNYPIELGNIELTKISTQWGDYENFIFKNSLDSPWYDSNYTVNSYVYGSRVFKYTLSSDDSWELLPTGVFSTTVNYSQLGTTKHYAVCNYFQDYNDVNDPTTDSWIMTQGNMIILHFNSSLNINSVDDLRTWLDNNEVIVYAIRGGLADYNSYNQAIEYSLQNQWFNAANSIGYDGGTVVTQENFDKPFDLSAKTIQKVTN